MTSSNLSPKAGCVHLHIIDFGLWVTPKPSHNKPNPPVLVIHMSCLGPFFCPRARSLEPLVLKCRTGVRGSTPRTTLGGQIPHKIDIRQTGFNMTGFRRPADYLSQRVLPYYYISIHTESQCGMGSKIRDGDKKTLRRLLRDACFSPGREAEKGTDQNLRP